MVWNVGVGVGCVSVGLGGGTSVVVGKVNVVVAVVSV